MHRITTHLFDNLTCLNPLKSKHKVECRKGEYLPDGSVSVVLSYEGGHYYFPDGSIMIGVHQVLCAKRKVLQYRTPLYVHINGYCDNSKTFIFNSA